MTPFIQNNTWPEHFLNGGTGVCINESEESFRTVPESVRLFNDPSIYMIGREMHTSRRPADLSDFWSFHRKRVKEEMPAEPHAEEPDR